MADIFGFYKFFSFIFINTRENDIVPTNAPLHGQGGSELGELEKCITVGVYVYRIGTALRFCWNEGVFHENVQGRV